jgi:5-oxoprolinase (ATP-hydrolysing)
MVGKLVPEFFPKIFGPTRQEPLDDQAVGEAFAELAVKVGRGREEIADGFIKIAVENMANAIKKISVQRGYDVTAMRSTASAAPAASTPAWSPTRSA